MAGGSPSSALPAGRSRAGPISFATAMRGSRPRLPGAPTAPAPGSRGPRRHHGNARWTASFPPPRPGLYTYVIEAWTAHYATWRRDFLLKREAGQAGTLEALEGAALLTAATPFNPELEQVIARR